VLKQAVGPLLPAVVTARKKKGFGMPVAAWLKGPLRSQMHDLLNRDRLSAAGVFDPAVVERLMAEHEAGTFDHRKQLWTLMMFEAWRERWGVTVSAPDMEAMT
jgi:asparagine synthase (glutamine-hydrolysing)